ncbi:MAG: regulatory protein MarR [Sphingomonadales bacterium]|nr:regulatory protein MarR [Sphingomonadales bacterium]
MGRVKSVLRPDGVIKGANPNKRTPLAMADAERLQSDRQSLGRQLYGLYRIYASLVLQDLHAEGFTDIRPVHTDVLRAIDLEGTRLTDVAARCNIAKQAAGQLAKELVALGYVTLVTHPSDTRVRLVVFTDRGFDLLEHMGKIFEHVDGELAATIGNKAFERFRHSLDAIISTYAPPVRSALLVAQRLG